jgi:hypothetical protein
LPHDQPTAIRVLLASAGLRRIKKMLWTIFVILLVLWLLGFVTAYTFGGMIHVLLLIAVVVLVFQLLAGRRSIL